jgi:hypothetical protein
MAGEDQLGAGLEAIIAAEHQHAQPDVYSVGSMLSYDERMVLHWATREGNPTTRVVVDAGCFLGGSTLALAGGIAARADGTPATVHSYDLFRFGSPTEHHWVPEGFDFAVGASTVPVFEHHVARVRPMVLPHAGDIRQAQWSADPIGVLFVDVAKSWSTGDAVWRQFFPALVPGESLIIQQDLVHWGHPWCAIVMELLADRFDYLGWAFYSSAVYRSLAPITADELPVSLLSELAVGEQLDLLERAATRLGEPAAGPVRLSGAVVLASHGDYDGARARIEAVRAAYSDDVMPFISEGFDYLVPWVAAVEAGTTSVD